LCGHISDWDITDSWKYVFLQLLKDITAVAWAPFPSGPSFVPIQGNRLKGLLRFFMILALFVLAFDGAWVLSCQ